MTVLEDEVVEAQALRFARDCRARLARQIADPALYPPENDPFTVFMAGSPGAGKTEVSKAMKIILESSPEAGADDSGSRVLRIDPDEFRCLFPGYTGSNSYLFQKAVTKVLEKVLDRAFDKNMPFILDGTLSNFAVARKNIDRVLRKKRRVQIIYVYQRPELAWKFVQARQVTEGRNIPLEEFVRQYFAARQNVKAILACYQDRDVYVDLLVKNTDGSGGSYDLEVTGQQIDDIIPEIYDRNQLIAILRE